MFHFLPNKEDQVRYVHALKRNLCEGGYFILSTFTVGGATQELPVVQYDKEVILGLLGPNFEFVEERREDHVTPSNAVQPFCYGVFLLQRGNGVRH